MPQSADHVSIPKSVLASAESIDELEDWLLSQNPQLVEELKRLRQEHLAGKGKDFAEILKRWPIE